MTADFVTVEPIIQAARKRLNQGTWDYLAGGAESETTLRRNRAAFDRIAFRPRILVDVSKSIVHHVPRSRVAYPCADRAGRLAATVYTRGRRRHGTGDLRFGNPVISSVTEPDLEVTAKAGDGPKMFQLYVRGDMAWTRDILARVKASGFKALALTVDTAVGSRRERPMLSTASRRRRGAVVRMRTQLPGPGDLGNDGPDQGNWRPALHG